MEARLTAAAWAALCADPSGLLPPPPVPLEVTGSSGHLSSHLAVEETAVACVATALLAAAALQQQRGGSCRRVSLDRGHVAAVVTSERHFRLAGEPAGPVFASLSRFWRTADGWVRTHANYPWHRAALLQALGTPAEAETVAAALADLPATEVEARVFGGGGIAAAVRSPESWQAHPQGQALAAEPLIGHHWAGDAASRPRPAGKLPAAGVRVLDLTRVIAGPVCTRFLAALGAQVLRLDPPHLPDMPTGVVADSLLGKRSAFLDLSAPFGLETVHGLLDHSDVVVCGYRPGALERFGLSAEALAERHPGLVIISLNAWGHRGPWSARRGFDSVVQAPTGIAARESTDGDEPGTLPCQLLDHGTGYLAAAAALDGLRRQAAQGGTHVRRLSLARTAAWLLSSADVGSAATTTGDPEQASWRPPTPAPGDPERPPWLTTVDSIQGPVTAVAPPGTIDDRPLRWPEPVTGYGDDDPSWSPGNGLAAPPRGNGAADTDAGGG